MIEPLQRELRQRNVSYDLLSTSHPGEATEAARNSGAETVVAVGGDGTINEVVNGLSGSGKNLGILPAGSGNDFIKSVSIPSNFTEALDTLLRRTIRIVDVGTVTCSATAHTNGNSSTRLFVNGVGVGFDAAVAARTLEIPYLGGRALYILAVLQMLGRYVAPEFTLDFHASTHKGKELLIAVGNGVCAGGGFYLTPDAVVDDGLLDVCVIEARSIPQILTLMPRVMRGKHHSVKGVKFFKEKHLSISAQEPFYVHADGEIVGRNVQRVEIGVKPKQLSVISGQEASAGT